MGLPKAFRFAVAWALIANAAHEKGYVRIEDHAVAGSLMDTLDQTSQRAAIKRPARGIRSKTAVKFGNRGMKDKPEDEPDSGADENLPPFGSYYAAWNPAIYSALKYSIVRISTVDRSIDMDKPYEDGGLQESVGSGFLVDENTTMQGIDDYTIVTNAHVVRGSGIVRVQFPSLGRHLFDATVPMVCFQFDLAIVKLKDPTELREKLKLANVTLSLLKLQARNVKMGMRVAALGFPLGSQWLKLSEGVVSGAEVVEDNMVYQSTAPISPGNSGGPLLVFRSDSLVRSSTYETDGRKPILDTVVGVNFASSASKSAQNLNYAVPAFRIVQVLAETSLQNGDRFMPFSLFRWAHPPIQTGSFLVKVDDTELDTFGMGKRFDFMQQYVSFKDLLTFREHLDDVVTVTTCNDGKSMQHSLSLKWNSSRFEGGVRYLYEPNFDETAKDYEWFAGVTMVQLTLNHVDAWISMLGGETLGRFYLEENTLQPRVAITSCASGFSCEEIVGTGMIVESINGCPVSTLADIRRCFVPKKSEAWELVTDRGVALAVDFLEEMSQAVRLVHEDLTLLSKAVREAALQLSAQMQVGGWPAQKNAASESQPTQYWSVEKGNNPGRLGEQDDAEEYHRAEAGDVNDSVEAQALTCVMNWPFMVMRATVFDPIAEQRAWLRWRQLAKERQALLNQQEDAVKPTGGQEEQEKLKAKYKVQELVTKPPTPKTEAESQLMIEALKQNDNLMSVVSLSDGNLSQMVAVAWKEEVKSGTKLITEGDLNADYFYIVQEGKFNVIIGESKSAEEGGPQVVASIPKGGSFGELALLYFAPRAATIQAAEDAVVWVIDRKNFKEILAQSSNATAKEYIKYLDKVEILAPLQDDEKAAVAQSLSEMSFSRGEVIFQQGEKGDAFYILIEGQVSVVKDGREVTKLIATPEKASFFGDRALLSNEPRNATLQVISDTAKTLTVDRQSFDMILGPLAELQTRGRGGKSKLVGRSVASSAVAMGNVSRKFGLILRKDLKRIGLLGCGGFGAVELVEHAALGDTYALKALSKGYVMKSGMQHNVLNEKNVQIMCDSPFIIKLYETYNGTQSLYFLLEPALGGELYATYNKKGLFGKESHAKFYVAGVVNAFEHLHGKKIIFRDLKPENLLLTELGHIKLTDMGLAKVVVGKTYTTCGTPDYFAPEMIASAGHTSAVDWWTLGVLSFELMAGHPPFESAHPMQIYQKVNKGISKVNFPNKMKGVVEDLVKNLCKKEPADRLPMRKGGAGNIRKHAWFSTFEWEKYDNGNMPSPYKPQVQSKKDMANFTARKEDMPPNVQYKDDGSGWDADFATCS
ncbi:egl-4 [Symbiodinium pilosum]|uniref:Egl-4 protein n=1 Tax=Symbiodinium pilosum TaxID=2952 RepID=A0A812YE67_SYMPI|nr:egl-4 [Symbiodinium pilosum]